MEAGNAINPTLIADIRVLRLPFTAVFYLNFSILIYIPLRRITLTTVTLEANAENIEIRYDFISFDDLTFLEKIH